MEEIFNINENLYNKNSLNKEINLQMKENILFQKILYKFLLNKFYNYI